MKTTINLDDDVLARARAIAAKLDTPFRQIVNEALRNGLDKVGEPAKSRPYRTDARRLGLKAGRNLDNIGELLDRVEGSDHR